MNTERKKNRELKRQFRMDKRRWNKDFASESENAARQQHMKAFFPRTKVLRNQRQTRCATVKDKNGNILSDKQSKTKRWYVWKGILGKIFIRSCAVRHYIVLHGYVPGDTISYSMCCVIVMEIPLCRTTYCDIVPHVATSYLITLYHNWCGAISYYMLLYRTR